MNRTIAQAVAAATARLREAGVDDPARDARRLVAFAAGIAANRLTLSLPDSFEAELALEQALLAREARQPVSQIIGKRMFYGRRFTVTPDVLDPRPETETLVTAALDVPFKRVLDIGTGTGCILLTLLAERPSVHGVGCDLSSAAITVARGNAERLDIKAEFVRSNWFSNINGRYDLIVSNPPYIAADEMAGLAPELRLWEPRMALTDEGDGLAAYRQITSGAMKHLLPCGRLMVEIGLTQGAAVAGLFQQAGFSDIRIVPDLDGRDRVMVGRAPERDS